MGFESVVDDVLAEAGIDSRDYGWHEGLVVTDVPGVAKIMMALENSGQFGPCRFDEESSKIEFGLHREFWKHGLELYELYATWFRMGGPKHPGVQGIEFLKDMKVLRGGRIA